jgi:hypothetical protein
MARVKAAKRRACEGSLDARHRSRTIDRRSVGSVSVRGARGPELADLERRERTAECAPVFMPEASRVDRARTPAGRRARSQVVGGRSPPRAHAHSPRAAPPGTARPRHDVSAPRARRLRPAIPNRCRQVCPSSADACSTIPISGKWYTQSAPAASRRRRIIAYTGVKSAGREIQIVPM